MIAEVAFSGSSDRTNHLDAVCDKVADRRRNQCLLEHQAIRRGSDPIFDTLLK